MRSRAIIEKSIQFTPKIEAVVGNQKVILEVMLDIREAYEGLLDRIRIFEKIAKPQEGAAFRKAIMDVKGATGPSEAKKTIDASYPALRATGPIKTFPTKNPTWTLGGSSRNVETSVPVFDPETGEAIPTDEYEPLPSTLDIPADDGVEDFLGTDKKDEPL